GGTSTAESTATTSSSGGSAGSIGEGGAGGGAGSDQDAGSGTGGSTVDEMPDASIDAGLEPFAIEINPSGPIPSTAPHQYGFTAYGVFGSRFVPIGEARAGALGVDASTAITRYEWTIFYEGEGPAGSTPSNCSPPSLCLVYEDEALQSGGTV